MLLVVPLVVPSNAPIAAAADAAGVGVGGVVAVIVPRRDVSRPSPRSVVDNDRLRCCKDDVDSAAAKKDEVEDVAGAWETATGASAAVASAAAAVAGGAGAETWAGVGREKRWEAVPGDGDRDNVEVIDDEGDGENEEVEDEEDEEDEDEVGACWKAGGMNCCVWCVLALLLLLWYCSG